MNKQKFKHYQSISSLTLVASLLIAPAFAKKHSLAQGTVDIAGTKVHVEIASTPAQRSKGLAGRKKLPKLQGMLFVFKKAGYYGFWMKGVKFPLDIIWINNDRVVDITANIKAGRFSRQSSPSYYPRYPAKYVLEVNAGFTKQYHVTINDRVNILY